MSDFFLNPVFGEYEKPATEVEGTGNAEVDAALESLRRLDDVPVAEHVALFEQAHETLRRTLAGGGQGSLHSPAGGRS